MTCDQFVLAADGCQREKNFRVVLPVNFDFDQSECRPSQVLTSGTSDSVLRKYKMFNDGTDLTAGINKGYQNGFTATLIKFSKHRGGPESASPFCFYSCQKRKT